VAAWATGVLLMISLGLYGTAVATGVAQEKTSRMAEVLLAAVRPSQLLAGKVLGIGVCGVGQLAIVVVAGLIANAAVQSAEIPATVWVLLPTVLLWFVLGYALYSFAYAAAGALVGRQEDVQFVSLPFGLPIFGGYLLPPPHGAHDEVGRWLNELGLGGRRASSSRPSRIPST
jgi:ABC-2 type transport system permease protein